MPGRKPAPPGPVLNEIADQESVIRHWHGAAGVDVSTGRLHVYRDLFHDHVKLVVAERTPWRIRRRGAAVTAQPGQLVVLHADDAHSGEPVRGADLGPWRIVCLQPDLLSDVTGDPAPRFTDPLADDPLAAQRFLGLYRLLEHGGPALARDEAALAFARDLGRRADAPALRPAGRHEHAVRVVRDYLGDHVADDVRLEDLSRLTGLSPYQIVRATARRYGLTPHRIHLALRLQRAVGMVERGQPLAEIAHALGFSDQAHLTRSFKRVYGTTPGRYRRALAT
jgi:AraC-like DNA-binding protein